ncbi:MAG: hypothetical protein JWN34_2457, partial [Bryobacterales bacterium]|nr:hypothetical protein [Bryobacterales bacterium]
QIVPLCEFLSRTNQLPPKPSERDLILGQAETLFRDLYAHMPFKAQLYSDARPLEALQELRQAMSERDLSELEFHTRVLEAFASVRDAHTAYIMPPPFNGAVAFLPFRLGLAKATTNELELFVTRIMPVSQDGGFGHPTFGIGATILRWDGLAAIEAVLEANAVGGNTTARVARGVQRATIRPLSLALPPPPSEETVTLEYRVRGSPKIYSIDVMWGVGVGLGPDRGIPSAAFSMNPAQCAVQYAQQRLWGRPSRSQPSTATGTAASPATAPEISKSDLSVFSALDKVFQFQHAGGVERPDFVRPSELTDGTGRRFAYIRVREFDGNSPLGNAADLQDEFRRILRFMDSKGPDGLVLDLRGNPGGSIDSAEQMLQMLTPVPVEPANFHLVNTPAMRQVLARLKVLQHDGKLRKWLDDDSDPHDPITGGRTISDLSAERARGQAYMGPVVLLVDGFTYSAADIFAGGFADHQIGPILGVGYETGGGGASVWTHSDLLLTLPKVKGVEVAALPSTVSMLVAFLRSSRVRQQRGKFIEDVGVESTIPYEPTFDDVTGTFAGLIRAACEQLAGRPVFRIDVTGPPVLTPEGVSLQITATGVRKLLFSIDGMPLSEADVEPGINTLIAVPGAIRGDREVVLLIEGLTDAASAPVVRTGVVVRQAPEPSAPGQQVESRSEREALPFGRKLPPSLTGLSIGVRARPGVKPPRSGSSRS